MRRIFGAIQDLLEKKDKIIVAIDGKSASGKTTLADFVHSKIDCNVFRMDDFCLTDEQRETKPYGCVNVDVARFYNEVVNNLQKDSPFDYDKFNFKENVYHKIVVVEQKPVNIVEGVYSCCDQLKDCYDLKIFLNIDDVEQKIRLANMDNFEQQQEFLEWEKTYFEKQSPQEDADIVCTSASLFLTENF